MRTKRRSGETSLSLELKQEVTLIADSGSTKTDWILISTNGNMQEVHTTGINPVRDSLHIISQILYDELLPQLPAILIDAIYFYGAGCIDPYCQTVHDTLAHHFPTTKKISVQSDLMGAAIALCGHQEGIACILGTGSNSCLYDGERITANTPALGFILGDEGSGAFLGRTLLTYLLKGILPTKLKDAFLQASGLTQADIINRVYRQPQPNRFLASLTPFIAQHREDPHIHAMLVEAFRLFFQRNIKAYRRHDTEVHFVGSIAHIFCIELREAATKEGMKVGRILRQPAQEIANFHRNCLETRK